MSGLVAVNPNSLQFMETMKLVPMFAHPELGVPVIGEGEGAVKIPPEREGAVVKELIVAEFPA